MHPASVLEQVTLAEPTVDPTGRWVVYARRTIEDGRYRERLWRVATAGGDPVLLAEIGQRSMRPRISPGGHEVMFLVADGSSVRPWLVPLAGGQARRLDGVPGDATAAEWCADGRHVAILAPSGDDRFIVGPAASPVCRRITDLTWRLDGVGIRDQFTSLWHADTEGAPGARLTPASFEVHAIMPAPDGRIAYLADRRIPEEIGVVAQAQAWMLDPYDGSHVEVARLPGGFGAGAVGPGGQLALVGYDRTGPARSRRYGLYIAGRDGGPRRLGESLERHVANAIFRDTANINGSVIAPAWLDEQHVVAIVNDHGTSLPYRFGLDGEIVRLADDDSICWAIAAGVGTVVVLATAGGRSGEICRVDAGRLTPLTTHGSAWQAPYRRDPIRVTIPGAEGHPVEVWYLAGRGVQGPGPFVLQVHGGAPFGSHGTLPQMLHVMLADAGIGVIWANPRGSGGYGPELPSSDEDSWLPQAADLMAVVDWAIDQGLADPARVGVTGLSSGGYTTCLLLGHYPGRFAAAVSESPVTDMAGALLTGDFAVHDDLEFPRDAELMFEISPYRLLHRNRTPVLLIHMDDDHRCPPSQTEIAFRILRDQGVVTEMIRYPGESHAMSASGRPDRRVDRLERIIDWFVRHLGVGDRPDGDEEAAVSGDRP